MLTSKHQHYVITHIQESVTYLYRVCRGHTEQMNIFMSNQFNLENAMKPFKLITTLDYKAPWATGLGVLLYMLYIITMTPTLIITYNRNDSQKKSLCSLLI